MWICWLKGLSLDAPTFTVRVGRVVWAWRGKDHQLCVFSGRSVCRHLFVNQSISIHTVRRVPRGCGSRLGRLKHRIPTLPLAVAKTPA